MRIIRKPIDVIAIFKRGEQPVPARVRMEVDGQEIVAKVDRIIKIQRVKNVGKGEIVYTCQSRINSVDRIYELKFLLDVIEWSLYKI
jgi:hypothetical protein